MHGTRLTGCYIRARAGTWRISLQDALRTLTDRLPQLTAVGLPADAPGTDQAVIFLPSPIVPRPPILFPRLITLRLYLEPESCTSITTASLISLALSWVIIECDVHLRVWRNTYSRPYGGTWCSPRKGDAIRDVFKGHRKQSIRWRIFQEGFGLVPLLGGSQYQGPVVVEAAEIIEVVEVVEVVEVGLEAGADDEGVDGDDVVEEIEGEEDAEKDDESEG